MEYKVIHHNNLYSFENEINSLLNQKWELQGGVSIAYQGGYHEYVYSQAMVRKK
jgi:hypothetical protein